MFAQVLEFRDNSECKVFDLNGHLLASGTMQIDYWNTYIAVGKKPLLPHARFQALITEIHSIHVFKDHIEIYIP